MKGLELKLELINGNWGLAALSLLVICAAYIRHEWMARRAFIDHDDRITLGMKMAAALCVLSLGVFIRSVVVYEWRHYGSNTGDLNETWLMIGGSLALVGFLLVIRQLSLRLFGQGPWLVTLVVMGLFTSASIASKFL